MSENALEWLAAVVPGGPRFAGLGYRAIISTSSENGVSAPFPESNTNFRKSICQEVDSGKG